MKVVDLDRETVKQGLADGSLLLIDVREDHEFARGHIPGSVSHPLSSFDPEALKALIAQTGTAATAGAARIAVQYYVIGRSAFTQG